MGDISRYFSRSEFKCKCNKCNCDTVDTDLLECLEAVREHFDRPVVINSGHRCPDYNKQIGGAKNSQHLYGRAADIVVPGIDSIQVLKYVQTVFTHMSTGSYPNFTHIDSRTDGPKRW